MSIIWNWISFCNRNMETCEIINVYQCVCVHMYTYVGADLRLNTDTEIVLLQLKHIVTTELWNDDIAVNHRRQNFRADYRK